MRRRDFITLLGGAATAWPITARAQQRPAMPVIGLLNGASFASYAARVTAFHQGLKESGFVEGQNVTIEYRSAEGQATRLPALAADLVRHQVAVIVGIGSAAPGLAAKSVTSTIPIVFAMGGDAIDVGLVSSLNQPDANVTGVSFFSNPLGPKRLELLRDLVPNVLSIGFLTNPSLSISSENDSRNIIAAAESIGCQVIVLRAGTELEIDMAFATLLEQRIGALVVNADAFFNSQRGKISSLAAHHAVPTIYADRQYVEAGGLMSYGTDTNEMFRQAGIYTSRILKGAKPAELPVMQPTKFELVINLRAAKALGLNIPESFLLRADEVIE